LHFFFFEILNSSFLNILILGNGAREHAFCWKVSQSDLCSKIFVAPGNAGTAQLAENIDVAATDFKAIKKNMHR
jgi:phosphoribosylamine--glycine ligase